MADAALLDGAIDPCEADPEVTSAERERRLGDVRRLLARFDRR